MKQGITSNLKSLEALERKEDRRMARVKRAYEKQTERLCFLLGSLFLEAFPECRRFEPKLTAKENEQEFRPVKDFLSAVAAERRPEWDSWVK